MGNPFYKASNGGFLEGYGKRRVSPKVNSAGKRNERGGTGKGTPRILSPKKKFFVMIGMFAFRAPPNGLPMPVSSEFMQRLGYTPTCVPEGRRPFTEEWRMTNGVSGFIAMGKRQPQSPSQKEGSDLLYPYPFAPGTHDSHERSSGRY